MYPILLVFERVVFLLLTPIKLIPASKQNCIALWNGLCGIAACNSATCIITRAGEHFAGHESGCEARVSEGVAIGIEGLDTNPLIKDWSLPESFKAVLVGLANGFKAFADILGAVKTPG